MRPRRKAAVPTASSYLICDHRCRTRSTRSSALAHLLHNVSTMDAKARVLQLGQILTPLGKRPHIKRSAQPSVDDAIGVVVGAVGQEGRLFSVRQALQHFFSAKLQKRARWLRELACWRFVTRNDIHFRTRSVTGRTR
jgi:hypothetical protein